MKYGDGQRPPSSIVASQCPQCAADLEVLRVIPGRADTEYWAMRCTACGRVHLDIVKPLAPMTA